MVKFLNYIYLTLSFVYPDIRNSRPDPVQILPASGSVKKFTDLDMKKAIRIRIRILPTLPVTCPKTNNHPMTTRSKYDIFKPKLYTAILIRKEPDIVSEALQDLK